MTVARAVLAITGADRLSFLQGLVTNDVSALGENLVYAALLSPQGKYLFDFFLFQEGESVFLDVADEAVAALVLRLNMYRLRADILIADSGLFMSRGLGEPPQGAFADPRHSRLGWRYYSEDAQATSSIDWREIYVSNVIPTTGAELISNESYILEMGFERLHGVDFKKGCYVGQEVTARMKHKTELRKGLVRVAIEGLAEPGDKIQVDGKNIGTLYTVAGNQALAYLRFDRAGQEMRAGNAKVIWAGPIA